MFSTLVSVLLGLTGVAVSLHAIGMWATWRYLRRKERTAAALPSELPPLSLLKPLKGDEDGLEANLISFYEQDYPAALQVVFTSTDADDPALAVARRVAQRYPHVETAFVLARPDYGMNPKVSNMHGGLQAVRHELFLQSDANVRLRPGYLRALVGQMLAQDASLIGSLVVGVGERTPGATLENLQLTAFTAPGLCMAEELASITCVLGKSMLLRRSEFEAMGGFGLVKDLLAEDYMLAQFYAQRGKRVALTTLSVINANSETRLPQFIKRHSRWLKMRAVVSTPGFIADLGSNPLPFAVGAVVASGFDARLLPVLPFVYAYKCFWDAALLRKLRGHGLGRAQLWATPARDLMLAAVWFYAAFSRTTEWRGRKLVLGPDSILLEAEAGGFGLRLLRRLGVLRGPVRLP
jgi:ceramide glucosyltransferase